MPYAPLAQYLLNATRDQSRRAGLVLPGLKPPIAAAPLEGNNYGKQPVAVCTKKSDEDGWFDDFVWKHPMCGGVAASKA